MHQKLLQWIKAPAAISLFLIWLKSG